MLRKDLPIVINPSRNVVAVRSIYFIVASDSFPSHLSSTLPMNAECSIRISSNIHKTTRKEKTAKYVYVQKPTTMNAQKKQTQDRGNETPKMSSEQHPLLPRARIPEKGMERTARREKKKQIQ